MKKFLTLAACFSLLLVSVPAHAQEEPVLPGDLIKGESSNAVYYYYGNRYAFPNEAVYFSWYPDFSKVKTVSDAFLASVPLADNVRFKPGSYMIKIQSDPKVYFLADPVTLRWIQSEADAERMYGADWAKNVRDVSVALFSGYVIGEPLVNPSYSNVMSARVVAASLDDDLFKMVDQTPTSLAEQLKPPQVTEANMLAKYGYSAALPGTEDDLVSFFRSVLSSDGWTESYDYTYVPTSYQETDRFLTFTKDGATPAVRSLLISLPYGSTGEYSSTKIDLLNNSVFYPRSAIIDTAQDDHLSNISSLTFDPATEVVPYYVNTAMAKGWDFVTERTEQDVLPLQSLYFKKPNSHDWLIVDVVDFASLVSSQNTTSTALQSLKGVIMIQTKNINSRD